MCAIKNKNYSNYLEIIYQCYFLYLTAELLQIFFFHGIKRSIVKIATKSLLGFVFDFFSLMSHSPINKNQSYKNAINSNNDFNQLIHTPSAFSLTHCSTSQKSNNNNKKENLIWVKRETFQVLAKKCVIRQCIYMKKKTVWFSQVYIENIYMIKWSVVPIRTFRVNVSYVQRFVGMHSDFFFRFK